MKGYHVYCTPTVAAERLGVHMQTLRRWAESGVISYVLTPGGHYRYDVDSYIEKMSAPKKVASVSSDLGDQPAKSENNS